MAKDATNGGSATPKKFTAAQIMAAYTERAKTNGINFESLDRHVGNFEYYQKAKSGNHQWLLTEIPVSVKEDLKPHELVLTLTTLESEELKAKGGVCDFYVGHPRLRNAAGDIQYDIVTGQPKPDTSVNRLEVELDQTVIRKANQVSVSEASEKNLLIMDAQDGDNLYANIRRRKLAQNQVMNESRQQGGVTTSSLFKRQYVPTPQTDTAKV